MALNFNLDHLHAYIEREGGLILPPTNEWEVTRYRLSGVIHIIYKNKKGQLTFTGRSKVHVKASTAPVSRPTTKQRKSKRARVLQRDGDACWLCGETMLEGDQTLEHLIPLAHGGSHDLKNLVLTHARCNNKLGHRSLEEKQQMRNKESPPWE